MATTIQLSDPISTLVSKTNTLINEVGNPPDLTTTDKSSIVAAINELDTQLSTIDTPAEIALQVEGFFSGNKFDIGGITIDSGTVNQLLKFPDHSRAIFGTDSDFHIYYDGTTDILNIAATGPHPGVGKKRNVDIDAQKVRIRDVDGDTLAEFIGAPNDAVTLKASGSIKLQTTANSGNSVLISNGSLSSESYKFNTSAVGSTDVLNNIKPLQVKDSTGSVVYAGYLVSTSSTDGTL